MSARGFRLNSIIQGRRKRQVGSFILIILALLMLPAIVMADVFVNHLSVSLSWTPNRESDVYGYEVYRSNPFDNIFLKASSGVIRSSSWIDYNVSDGSIYYYKLRTVDLAGNTSDFSPQSEAVIIDVSAPSVTAEPAAGTYYQDISVTLKTNEPATIYYSIDGSVPTQDSLRYTTSLAIRQDTILRFFAVDFAGNSSPVVTCEYIIKASDGDLDNDGYPDTLEEAMGTAPENASDFPTASQLILEPSGLLLKFGGTAKAIVTGIFLSPEIGPIAFDMTRLVSYGLSVADVVTVDATGLIQAVAQSGEVSVTLTAQASVTSNQCTIIVDNEGPTVSASPGGGTFTSPVVVSLDAGEPATIYYTINGANPSENSDIYSTPFTLESDASVRCLAKDDLGNTGPVTIEAYSFVPPDSDYDDDGYSNELEISMGADPMDAASIPLASSLALTPSDLLIGVGATSQLTVIGTFEPLTGDPVQYDVTGLVEYRLDPPGYAGMETPGEILGQLGGTTRVWAVQIVDGRLIASSNTATVTVDGLPPYVDTVETHPYDGQGINEDNNGNGVLDPGEDLDGDSVLDVDDGPTPRVPSDTGIMIRVADNVGIDGESIEMSVNGIEVSPAIQEILAGDRKEIDVGYRNKSAFAFGQIVTVEFHLCDLAGNSTHFKESFRIESEAQHQWAIEHRPVQSISDLGDGTCEVKATPTADGISDELLSGGRILFSCDEPVAPRFGPVGELPSLDIASPVGIPMNLEPPGLFEYPVKLIVPLPGMTGTDTNGDGHPDTGLQEFQIYQYSAASTALWRNVADVPGWMVEGSRSDHYESSPATIELSVRHFSGVQVGCECLPPAADFVIVPTGPNVGEAVQFQDLSTGTISEWLWDFGDGTSSSYQNPSHVYTIPGDYLVVLSVTGSSGSDTKSTHVLVCDEIHLLAPENRDRPADPPTFTWTAGCNTRFQMEVGTNHNNNFEAEFETTVLIEPSYSMDVETWNYFQQRTWLYWRVKGWNEANPDAVEITSVDEWAVRR